MRLAATLIALCISTDAMAFQRGHNICGINTAQWRKAHGLRVPRDFAAARSWLKLPRSSAHYGAVMITWGKHQLHVSPVLNNGICHDPSSSAQRWVDKPCSTIWRGRKRVFVN